jgi:hypothetical protein
MSTITLFLLAIGGYLIWFGITHFGDINVFGPLKSLLQGQGLK